jgi:hypothetical protein
MADLPNRIGPVLFDVVPANIHTVPLDRTFTARNIHVANVGAVEAKFTLSIGVDAAGTRIYHEVPIEGNGGVFDWSGYMPLEPGEVIEGFCDLPNAMTVTISGVDTL